MPSDSARDERSTTLVARALWRKARRRLRTGPLFHWRFVGLTPDRVRLAPPDLRLTDAQIAHDIYSSRFPLAGHLVDTGGISPFQVEVDSSGWSKALHSFRWLRHLSAAGTDLARANARALVSDWIERTGKDFDGVAWDPGTTSKRIIAWLQHSSLLLNGAELPFYRLFLRSLSTQIRYLRVTAPEMNPGKDRLRARVAIAFAGLALPSSSAFMRTASRHLTTELQAQILPDGGHISRNPLALLDLLADLLPLRQTYAEQAVPVPEALVSAVDRMLPALRFFRHLDGSLARFNGNGVTIHERVNSVLRHDASSAAPLLQAPHSGYQRLVQGQTVVIVDTGAPPPPDASGSAHAGCLSFEMSSGRACFIVNCGVDSYGPREVRALARATAAHSTATINDASQGTFMHGAKLQKLIGGPLLGGARRVTSKRGDTDEFQRLTARHDAYVARFGLIHERELTLGSDGFVLQGIDRFIGTPTASTQNRAAIRFHLHPDVEVFDVDHDGGLGIASQQGLTWVFQCPEVRPRVEESIYFASSAGARRTSQIVLEFDPAEQREVHWKLTRQRI